MSPGSLAKSRRNEGCRREVTAGPDPAARTRRDDWLLTHLERILLASPREPPWTSPTARLPPTREATMPPVHPADPQALASISRSLLEELSSYNNSSTGGQMS